MSVIKQATFKRVARGMNYLPIKCGRWFCGIRNGVYVFRGRFLIAQRISLKMV